MIEFPPQAAISEVRHPEETAQQAHDEPCGCPGAALRVRKPGGSADLPVLGRPQPGMAGPGPSGKQGLIQADRDLTSPAAPAGRETAGAQETPPRESQLSHWPVQIRLVPPAAPFLAGSNLLVAADCVPVAAADFHDRYLAGRTVMMGCPKFDPPEVYVDRFTRIFAQNPPARVAVAVMEVPCCSSLPRMVLEGMKQADRYVPMEILVVGTDGVLLERREMGVEALRRSGR